MEQIRIGSSDLNVGSMGVGAMPWSDSGLFGYGSRIGIREARAAFGACVSAGMTLFDTAEIYGFGRSERILGTLVREEERPTVVATKYAPYPWRLANGSVVAALRGSLRRLGLPRVDLYQIHFPSPWLGIERLMNGLADAVEAGLTRSVGVSNFSAAQMRDAHAALSRRGMSLASNQVEYSLVHRRPETNGVLDACRDLEVTLIAYSPLGRGVLSGRYRPGNGPADMRRRSAVFRDEGLARIEPLIGAMIEIGATHGDRPPAQVALNWLARQPLVLPIPGAKNATQARDNAASVVWKMTDDEVARLVQLSEPLQTRSRR